MKATLFATFVALLMVGCGEEVQKKAIQNETKDDPSVPLLIPCEACGKEVSKSGQVCANCSHPITDSVDTYVKEREAEPFGGLEVLAEIKEAKESNTTSLYLHRKQ
ncbi:MAG: hypothetical protein VYC03_09690, partial [Pseudomonadota bacterium]|nr:hypothetical protein [Pseudomonadota bacterium]